MEWLTVKEISKRLKLSEITVRKRWRSLGGVKVLGSIRFEWEKTLGSILEKNQEGNQVVLSVRDQGKGIPGRGVFNQERSRDRRSRRKAYFERVPDRHGLLGNIAKVS